MTKEILIVTLSVQFIFLLACCDGSNFNGSKGELQTIIMIDSASIQKFEKAGTMLKYMTDEGMPVMEFLSTQTPKVAISVERDYIEIGLQNYQTVTQCFILRKGDSTWLTTNGRNFILRGVNHDGYRFDATYPTERNNILFEHDESGAEKFLQLIRLADTYYIDLNKDHELKRKLYRLEEEAYLDFEKENQFLDSLKNDSLISDAIEEFYRLKISFDSIKIASYIESFPSFKEGVVLRPFTLLEGTKRKVFNNYKHLTFFDDWLAIQCNYLHALDQNKDITLVDIKRAHSTILQKDLPHEIRNSLLLRNVINGCDRLPSNECEVMLKQLLNDLDEPWVLKQLNHKYGINL